MNRHPNTHGLGMKSIPPGITPGNWHELQQSIEGPRPEEISTETIRANGRLHQVHVFAPAKHSDDEDFYRIYRQRLRAQGAP